MALSDVRIRISCSDAALAELYPGQQPFLFGGPFGEAGPVPLSVAVYRAEGHLHYVGLGREGADAELSFRLVAPSPQRSIPGWPVHLLNEFATHAMRRGRPFDPGHYLCLREPVDPDSWMRCGILLPDPELAGWLQIVGLHERELGAVSGDGYEALVRELRRTSPSLVTAPGRAPLLPR